VRFTLARVGVNEQTAILLTGHSDSKTHRRYLEAATIRALPAAAVPIIDSSSAALVANGFSHDDGAKPQNDESRSSIFLGAGHGVRTQSGKHKRASIRLNSQSSRFNGRASL
jgi:hypothetical protein